MEERRYSSWMLERIGIGDTVRLRLGASTIGRHSSSVIRIMDSTYVSRHHAIISVSDNDQRVSLQDVSSNGIYVNNERFERVSIELNNNDIIGVGVTATDYENPEDILRLPIYELKYAPIRPLRIPNVNRPIPLNIIVPPSAPTSSAAINVNNNNNNNNESNNKKDADNNFKRENDNEPCCSKSAKVEKITNNEEIFEISDDEDEVPNRDVVEKSNIQQMDVIIQQRENEPPIQNLLSPKVVAIKSETTDDKNFNHSLEKSQENILDKVISKTEINTITEGNDDDQAICVSQKSLNENAIPLDVKKDVAEEVPTDKSVKEPVLHVPIISNIKKEIIRSLSGDIQDIFGDIDDDIAMRKAIKDINPLIYNEMHVSNVLKPLTGVDDQLKMLNNGDHINLIDDEDYEVEELGIITLNTKDNMQNKDATTSKEAAKSPNVFEISLESSDNEAIPQEEKQINESLKKLNVTSTNDKIDLDEYTKYTPNSDDEDIEDLLFSQVFMNDMKDELQEDHLDNQENLPLSQKNIDDPIITNPVLDIKQEPGLEVFSVVPKELENSCWIISDDEDFDEELETKVNDWSNKIFSQSFQLLSQNMSQVYEIEESGNSNEAIEMDDMELDLLEDDLEGIAEIYSNREEKDKLEVVFQLNIPNEEKKEEQALEILKDEAAELLKEKSFSTEDDDKSEEKLSKTENDLNNQNIENKQEQVNNGMDAEKCDDHKITTNDNLCESPLVRKRRMSKTTPIIQSDSSSEDEFEMDDQKQVNDALKITYTDQALTRLPPPIIEAPSLPKHKGKLRGVSAEFPKGSAIASVQQRISSIKDKIHQDNYRKNLKRKWMEKPSLAKKRDKDRKKIIKEYRKDKLKELAERKKSPAKGNDAIKRKRPTEDHSHKPKVAKVKVTTHNRGTFLVNNDHKPTTASASHKPEQKTHFKIPKILNKTSKLNKNKEPPKRALSIDGLETFSQQISKPDELLLKMQNADTKKCDKSHTTPTPKLPPIRRHSIAETLKNTTIPPLLPPISPICREAIAARAVRTTNKITFASMEKNIIESEENKRKLNKLSSINNNNVNAATPLTSTNPLVSTVPLTSVIPLVTTNSSSSTAALSSAIPTTTITAVKKKKSVRFNETPIIHYIERVTGAHKKIQNKDVMPMTTYKDRRHLIRTIYPLIDETDAIISKILSFSNEWLIKRNAAADAASDVVYPMPTHFNSFEHYKSIIFPLMKLEFVSTLEREYNTTKNVKNFKVSLEYATQNKDRIMLVTKLFHTQSKELTDSSLFDLVLLQPDQRAPKIFAYVVANRKGAASYVTIVYEVIAKNYTVEYFRAIKEFLVRPVMDRVRVHFGAFNSVYQLQSTPLFQKIINPLELLKCRSPPKKKVQYRGFDQLNDKQKQVLLSTYIKIIDDTTPNITLIQGPPGTGKSCVITNLALQTLYGEEVRFLDKKILICAQSNAAVDVIAGKLFDISLRMRPEKRFRLIRYGMLNKIHPKVMPIALQNVIKHDQLKKLQAKNNNIQLENKENLKNQILQFEAQIAEMSSRNIRGTVQEDTLIEKKRQLQLMRNILNESMRPEDERSLFTWYLSNANIVCATLSSCVNLMQYVNFFDICIIDEATQCTEPWTLLPLKFGINSLVLVGDTQQLPATVISKKANKLGLGTSMFTRIQQCLDNILLSNVKDSNLPVTTPNSIICSLQTQYRMHPEICRWPNQYFYRNELINGKSVLDFTKSPLLPFSVLNLSYTQHNSDSNGKINNSLEADFVAKLLKALDGFIPNKYNSYGVITPYAHHRATLESSIRSLGLTNIMVNTIDSYQGVEKDVIVISNARTHGIGFLSNPQRLNVALTRSKKCLILCGNFKNLESVPAWRCLLESARQRKLYFEITANCIADTQRNVIDKIKLKH